MAVRIYERRSALGGGRVTPTMIAIASGGSQAIFWKINTIGEDSFLEKAREEGAWV